MTVSTITPDGARVLKLLAAGKTTQQVADASSWPRERVKALAAAQKGWLLDVASDQVYDPNSDDGSVTLPPEVAGRAEQCDRLTFETALARAEASNDPRLLKLAGIARPALTEIVERLAAAREAAALADEIERLHNELAAKQARHKELTGRRTVPARPATPRPREDSRERRDAIRAWAAEHGYACPRAGRIPKTVENAYNDAHGGTQ